jgi:hypothetical protein
VNATCAVDRGKTAVYAAEDAAFGGAEIDTVVAFAQLHSVGRRTIDGEWWSLAGGPPVEVVRAPANALSSSARVCHSLPVVHIAAAQSTVSTLAHELAHVLAGVGHGHDELFRSAHVDMVAVLAGSGPARQLERAYRDFGLAVARRPWPPPFTGRGDTFLLVP